MELPRDPVAEWSDSSAIPLACRNALKKSSGITIPARSFILKVILAYIIVNPLPSKARIKVALSSTAPFFPGVSISLGVPGNNTRVAVTGRIEQGFNFGGRSFGTILRETQRRHY